MCVWATSLPLPPSRSYSGNGFVYLHCLIWRCCHFSLSLAHTPQQTHTKGVCALHRGTQQQGSVGNNNNNCANTERLIKMNNNFYNKF